VPFFCGSYNNDFIETTLSFGALLSPFDAKQIIMLKELFDGLEITKFDNLIIGTSKVMRGTLCPLNLHYK
jgi:hypothetical protein